MPDRRRRLLSVLLWLYPKDHRERYAEEMRACYLADLQASRGDPRFWAALILDHVEAAAAVRRRRARHASGRLRTAWDDVRNAVRSLRRAPVFSSFSILTLGLGMGAATAAFGVLNQIELEPLPYPDARRLVLLGLRGGEPFPDRPRPLSAPLFAALQAAPGPAEQVVGASSRSAVLTSLGTPVKVSVAEVTSGFFEFFGASPESGRLIVDADRVHDAPAVAVLGHDFWTHRFGADPGMIGRRIVLDNVPRTIIGVLAEEFVHPEALLPGASSGDVWLPFPLEERIDDFSYYVISAVARIRPSSSAREMNSHLARTFGALYGARRHEFTGTTAEDLRAYTVGSLGPLLWSAFAAVGILLILSLVNVTSLILTRGAQRSHDLAVRVAIGAGRTRLVRELVSEGAVLALAGGALSSAIAFIGLAMFRRFAPDGIPRIGEVALDARGVAFAASASVCAVLLTSLLPSWGLAARSTAYAGKHIQRSEKAWVREALVFAATTVSVVSLATAGLLIRDLARRVAEHPGYRPEGLVSIRVSLPSQEYPTIAGRAEFWRRLYERVQATPGVVSASLASELPTTGFSTGRGLTPDGHEAPMLISTVNVSHEFRTTVGISLIAGRWFTDADRGEPVALVNEAFVRAYWPESPTPVGLNIASGAIKYRVVGVTADVRASPGVGPKAKVYFLLDNPGVPFPLEVVARVEAGHASLTPQLRAVVLQTDANLLDVEVRTLESLIFSSLERPRFYAVLFSSFGILALILALGGVYGATTYVTRAKSREMGIRLALGAERPKLIHTIVLRMGGVLAGAVAAGLLATAIGSTPLRELLLTISPRDGFTYVLVGATVLSAGLVAVIVPARRASAVDPACTLKEW